jgi:LysW-gamma-L-lysine carboxypeptidase
VDAKGPLAAFVAAGARLGDAWARRHDLRVVVVGAVEEEYATSKGARTIAAAFDGVHDRVPDACVIGEPSSWQRVTLGYKGRLLVELSAQQPMAHTAGPDAGVATVAVDLWDWIAGYAERFNTARPKVFDQLGPSLRQIQTATNDEMHDTVRMQIGVRLPLEFDAQHFADEIAGVAATRIGAAAATVPPIEPARECGLHLRGAQTSAELRFQGYEAAWRSGRDTLLVRSFLAAIREVEPDARPSFVVKTGTSDMNVVGPLWGCPIVAYGPGDSSLDHTPHEHIVLDEYWRAVRCLERALQRLAETLAGA